MASLNWAGNLRFSSSRIERPTTVAEVQSLVAREPTVKALGTRHSFTPIADTAGVQIDVTGLDRVRSISTETMSVWVDGGIRYGKLAAELEREGLALANMASLPHLSVAGACGTGSHGSGVGLPALSSAVRSIEFVLADGSIERVSRDERGDVFGGVVVHLGALGVATGLELEVVPSYRVAQVVYERLPMESVEDHLPEILRCGYSVSLFTDWSGDTFKQVWVKRKVDGLEAEWAPTLFGATQASSPRHMIAEMPPLNCTEQLGAPGSWNERLPHFRLDFMPSGGQELQTEYLVPMAEGLEALKAIQPMGQRIFPHLYVTEVRTVAADEFWMSPAFKRDSLAIHFTWRQHMEEVPALITEIEERLQPFLARPHWGKIFNLSFNGVKRVVPLVGEFQKLAATYDPSGKFRNEFLSRRLFA